MKAMAVLGALFLFLVNPATADLPNPCCITSLDAAQRLLLIPDMDGSDPSVFGTFTVTVRDDFCIPINNAVVEVRISGESSGKVKQCAGAVTVKYTDPQGVAVFNIPGGGCIKQPEAMEIRANGVIIRVFDAVMSPDYAAWDNAGLADKWSLSITAVDFAAFARALGAGGSSCHDYDNNGTTGASDLSVFGQVWSGGQRACSP
jgi:hypothetical protein